MKTVSERPSIWYVIVTVMAMLYLGNVAAPLALKAPSWLALLFDVVLAAAWLYLVLDLMRQVSLFFPRRAK